MRANARPARRPDESSVLLLFARSGPTKEAHRRALNRSGGLRRSVAGQGHGRFLPVTLPRERPDQGKRREVGSYRYAVACVPIMVGIMVVIDVSNRVPSGNQENAPSTYDEWFELPLAIAGGCDGPRA